jgi:hypothetical protein
MTCGSGRSCAGGISLFAALPVTLIVGCTAAPAATTTPAPRTATAPGQTAAQAPTPGPGGDTAAQRGGGSPGPRPYARVITREARTRSGLFKTHMVGERLYFEIPRRELGRDMLLLGRTAAAGDQNAVFAGNTNYVRWEREGNRVILRQVTYDVTADTTRAIHRAVEAQRFGPIIASFNVDAYGPDSAAVIDATRLFTTNVQEVAGVQQVQSDRSFVTHVAPFEENVEIDVVQTGQQVPTPGPNQGPQAQGGQPQRPRTVSAHMHYSLRKLPEQPMRPRLHDRRVGFGSVAAVDYSSAEHESYIRRYIRRFRLEKKDANADISEPVKPIVFWIDPATPEWIVPWVKRGVEQWRVAFEEAGFRNAIEGRVAPTRQQDADFSIFDARHSAIYWRPYTVPNATGGQVIDPRTGEILKAEVNMYHNIMDLQRRWYFVQVGPLDARARRLPLPDSLMGELVEYVVAHEVGHAIGYPHNMKASSQYPADSIRSRSFLRRMGGHVATLMDYSRFNYVAQPEDSIPPELLIPRVGPYDKFAVMWGHKPIPTARTPDEERATLDRWARMQDTVPWLRFTTVDATGDPFNLTEAVGDEDAVKSSKLGLRNLERVMRMMVTATETPGRDYTLLSNMYGEAISQWSRYHGHVASIVGGAETQERYGTGERFTPVAEAKQREAVRYLNDYAFRVPAWLIDPAILRRIEQEGVVRRIRTAQSNVLGALLDESRLNRLVDYEVLAGGSRDAYTVAELLADMRQGVWSELTMSNPQADVFRRNLQRAYLEVVDRQLNPPPTPTGQPVQVQFGPPRPPRFANDARAVLRGELLELTQLAQRAATRTSDAMTRLHLRDVQLEIERILRPEGR